MVLLEFKEHVALGVIAEIERGDYFVKYKEHKHLVLHPSYAGDGPRKICFSFKNRETNFTRFVLCI